MGPIRFMRYLLGDNMKVVNEKYYIHENQDGTFAIWTIDDLVKMTTDLKTKKEAEKLLKIMPHSKERE